MRVDFENHKIKWELGTHCLLSQNVLISEQVIKIFFNFSLHTPTILRRQFRFYLPIDQTYETLSVIFYTPHLLTKPYYTTGVEIRYFEMFTISC